jgi:hypothetical protein
MERMRAQAVATFGKVDIFINDAEAVVFKAVIDHTIEEWDRVFAVNLRSALIGVKLFLPDMLERKQGVIITMQSSEGMPYLSAYLASKVGLRSFTLSLVAEVGDTNGVSVYCFGPGMVDTPAVQRAAQELAPLYKVTPEEFVRSSAPGGRLTTVQVCATGLVGTILYARDFHVQGDVHFLYGLAKLGLDVEGKPIQAAESKSTAVAAISDSSLGLVALNRKMEEVVRANQKEYESLSMFQKPVIRRMFQQGTGLKVEEWIAQAEAMTYKLESHTATSQMLAEYTALIQRMIAFITKQESDARGWIKDPKQLESALAALAERKNTAQSLLEALAAEGGNATS